MVADPLLAAEQAFQKGIALLRETKTASAAIELGRACELQPESLEYLLYATWAKARSYREVPSEPDQHALLDIAHRAKKRDPAFAFGSYVIGQLSMWAGDDATAKKWFYEALRLDPTSEAGAQVRILARRGTGIAERAPVAVAVSEPPVQAAAAVQPASAPSSRWPERLVIGAALVATGALVIFAAARTSAPTAGPTPSASAQPGLSVDSAAPVAAEPGEPDAGPKPDVGTVVLPSRASGHRIFVDGRRVRTDGIEPIRLRCGPHVVQIGSSGTPEPIDLPCGGEVQLQ